MRDRLKTQTMSEDDANAHIQAWEAHASFAHTRKLRNAIPGPAQTGRKADFGVTNGVTVHSITLRIVGVCVDG